MKRYETSGKDDLIFRDHLAIHRTVLANERTLLAYTRTALTLFVAGVTFLHFFESPWLSAAGWALVPAGAATLIVGAHRYRGMRSAIEPVNGRIESPPMAKPSRYEDAGES